jgi:hypothetical protein
MKKMITMLAVFALVLALAPAAQAGVVWTFTEVGADVVATASGSFSVDIARSGDQFFADYNDGGSDKLIHISGTSHYAANLAGTSPGVAGLSAPDAGNGTGIFGQAYGYLYWDSALSIDEGSGLILKAGTDISSSTTVTVTWSGKDLSNIITGGLTTTPVLAWTRDGVPSDTIHYVAVPEPATMSLLAIGGIALIRRRRRA